MHIYKQIDFMNNRNLVYALNVAAVIAFIIFLWLFGAIAGSVTFNFDKTYFIWLIVALLVVFTVHEVIHGFLYKLFDHHAKIKIGFKTGLCMLIVQNRCIPNDNLPGLLRPHLWRFH